MFFKASYVAFIKHCSFSNKNPHSPQVPHGNLIHIFPFHLPDFSFQVDISMSICICLEVSLVNCKIFTEYVLC